MNVGRQVKCANRSTRRGLTLAGVAALLTTTAWAAVAMAAPGGTHPAPPRAGKPVLTRTTVGGDLATPGWRVVKKFGPDNRPVGGLISVVSAADAWTVWSGSTAFIAHWSHGAWHDVNLPHKVAAALFAPVAIGASAGGEVWVFPMGDPAEAIRHTGGKWVVQPIPRWVLRPANEKADVATAVFGPRNVWVFSLGDGAYAAHYNGHSWAKVKMPEVPLGVSASAPGDIWAIGPNVSYAMRWNGAAWVKVGLPVLPLPFGATVSYSNITAIGPRNAWVMRTISYKSGLPTTGMLHWNGSAWLTVASPADVVDSLVPDGHGGLWAVGADINPSGFWFFYHLVRGHWTQFTPPGVIPQYAEELAWIPGTRSVWATGISFNAKGDFFGVLLKYGP